MQSKEYKNPTGEGTPRKSPRPVELVFAKPILPDAAIKGLIDNSIVPALVNFT